MVGSVGMVRGLSRPGSLVIQEALNLLSALGGDSEGTTTKLLMEMRGVQDNNLIVLANAKTAVVEANKREAEVVEEEAELVRNLREAEELYAGRLSDIVNSEEGLQRRVEEVDARVSEENNSIREREGELDRKLGEYRESLRTSKEELVRRENILKEDRDALKELESSLKNREEDIKSVEITLDDLQVSLDERKLELDKRDARVLAAMEGRVVVEGR
jgi:chromosome segregation ATPase